MATVTLGTTLTTSLSALAWSPADSDADVATIGQAIKDDINPSHPIWPGAFTKAEGRLYVPNRGFLLLMPGDYVAVDSTGWPILVSKNAIAAGPWTHS